MKKKVDFFCERARKTEASHIAQSGRKVKEAGRHAGLFHGVCAGIFEDISARAVKMLHRWRGKMLG